MKIFFILFLLFGCNGNNWSEEQRPQIWEIHYTVYYPNNTREKIITIKSCDKPNLRCYNGVNYISIPCNGFIEKTIAPIEILNIKKI